MPLTGEMHAGDIVRHISHGSLYLLKVEDIDQELRLLPYAHYLRQAWQELNLDGVLCVDARPTVYVCESARFSQEKKSEMQRFVWNQGLVPLLVLISPGQIEAHSGVRKPAKTDAPADAPDRTLITNLGDITDAVECAKFIRSIETGQFFHRRADFFPPSESVDRCLVRNLVDEATKLRGTGWKLDRAHALLGRALFVSFLHQRAFIKPHHFPGGTASLLEIVTGRSVEESKRLLYGDGGLFSVLKKEFNGTMFDDALAEEAKAVRKAHIEILGDFLGGSDVKSGQRTLFSDYDFKVIPVETISAIYEEFMKEADLKRKQDEGAFYTPRHLAETTLHIAIEDRYAKSLKWRVLDPACGSGIFLVAAFNLFAAQWLRDNPTRTKKTKAQELLDILLGRIRGVDVNLDACRITAFSLYLALFEKLQPIDLDEFKEKVRPNHFLPALVWSRDDDGPKTKTPVICHGDALEDKLTLEETHDLVIGNPPWDDRGEKQIALRFAKRAPDWLSEGGIGCLILPTTILVNRNGTLDGDWFRSVTVEKIVQLADYRKLMFASAIHAGFIVRFRKEKPTLEHSVIYETPKASRFDRRRGIIVVEPDDQKVVPMRDIVEAAIQDAQALKKKDPAHSRLQSLWSRRFWGSPRDEKLLRRLSMLPSIQDAIDAEGWNCGVGFKPYYPGASRDDPKPLKPDWNPKDFHLPNNASFPELVAQVSDFKTLGECLANSEIKKTVGGKVTTIRASTDSVQYKPENVFVGPMVIFSEGFTKFAFYAGKVRFEHSLRSISGNDKALLQFLTAVLGSQLTRYQAFHSGSSNGIGRDKLHLYESLNLPFPLPNDELAPPNAADLVKEASAIIQSVEKEGARAIPTKRESIVAVAKAKLEPLVEEYFMVSAQERMLIADTIELWQPSIHKQNLDNDIPSLRFPEEPDRRLYADTLTAELHRFSRKERIRTSVECMASEELNLIYATVIFGEQKRPYRETGSDAELWKALDKLNKAATKENGPICYLRGFTFVERDRIHILKPATMRNWCRTAALNDADAIFEHNRSRPA